VKVEVSVRTELCAPNFHGALLSSHDLLGNYCNCLAAGANRIEPGRPGIAQQVPDDGHIESADDRDLAEPSNSADRSAHTRDKHNRFEAIAVNDMVTPTHAGNASCSGSNGPAANRPAVNVTGKPRPTVTPTGSPSAQT